MSHTSQAVVLLSAMCLLTQNSFSAEARIVLNLVEISRGDQYPAPPLVQKYMESLNEPELRYCKEQNLEDRIAPVRHVFKSIPMKLGDDDGLFFLVVSPSSCGALNGAHAKRHWIVQLKPERKIEIVHSDSADAIAIMKRRFRGMRDLVLIYTDTERLVRHFDTKYRFVRSCTNHDRDATNPALEKNFVVYSTHRSCGG